MGIAAVRLQPRQREQLLHALGRLPHRIVQRREMAADAFAVGLAQRQFRLRLDHGQRCFQLVRGIGEEALAGIEHAQQPRHVLVDGGDQRRDLRRQAVLRQRRERIRIARGHAGAQLAQRPQAPPHAQPDDAERQQHQQPFLQQRARQHVVRQGFTRLDRFADQDPHRPDLRRRGIAHRQQLRCHADLHAAQRGVVEHRAVRLGRPGGRQGQFVVAGERVAARVEDAVEDAAARLRFEHLQGQVGQVDDELPVAQPDAVAHGLERGLQRAVEGPVGGGHGTAVGQPGIERQQAQQRQQQPQQQLPAQAGRAHRPAAAGAGTGGAASSR